MGKGVISRVVPVHVKRITEVVSVNAGVQSNPKGFYGNGLRFALPLVLCVLLVWFQRNLVVHLFLQFAISYRGVAASLEIYCGSLSVLINECYIENWGLVGLLLK